MNSYERFMTALERREPDRVPICEFAVNPAVYRKICPEAQSQTDFEVAMDFDAVCVGCKFEKVQQNPDGSYVDEWGVLYGPSEEVQDHPIEAPIRTREDLDSYTPPDPDAPHRLGVLPELVKRFKRERAIIFVQRASFMHSVALRGFEQLLTDFLLEPDLAHALLDEVLEANIRVARNAIRAGADVIVLADDYAGNKTTFFSPAVFEEFLLPRLTKIVAAIHEEGAKVVKHSDGNLWRILDGIVSTGIDAINPLEPVAGMDIGEVKAKYGDRVAVIGNIDCAHVLSDGSVEDVRSAVRDCIRAASPGGGHILASSNSIHSAVRPENYRAMIEAAKELGRYTLNRYSS
jgi:uroporphyrinogen decarboxylase